MAGPCGRRIPQDVAGCPRRTRTHFRERKVRRPCSPVPPEISDRRHLQAGAPLRCSCLSLNGVPPRENPLPSVGLSPGRPPLNDLHREVAVTDAAYSAQGLSQPGPVWVAVPLPTRRGAPPGTTQQAARDGRPAQARVSGRLALLRTIVAVVHGTRACTELALRRPGEREPRH
jgi:hypothetical protein